LGKDIYFHELPSIFAPTLVSLAWYPIEKIESGSIELEVTGIDLYNTLESLQSSMCRRAENKELEHLLDQWKNLTPAECLAEFRQVAIWDRTHHFSI